MTFVTYITYKPGYHNHDVSASFLVPNGVTFDEAVQLTRAKAPATFIPTELKIIVQDPLFAELFN